MLASNKHWKVSLNTDWIFDRFFIDFYGFWKARILIPDKQSTRNPFFSKFVIFLIFDIFIGFGSHVGCQNPPKIHQKIIKNLSKKKSKIRHFYRFFTDFGRILGAKWGLCWGYVGYKTLSGANSKKTSKNDFFFKKKAGGDAGRRVVPRGSGLAYTVQNLEYSRQLHINLTRLTASAMADTQHHLPHRPRHPSPTTKPIPTHIHPKNHWP